MVQVRVTINQAAVTRMVTDPRSPVRRHAERVGLASSAVAKTFVGVNTGRLRQTIGYRVIPQPPTKIVTRVEALTSYALVHHQGHKVIRPRRGKWLVWTNKRGEKVFAKKVRAVAGTKYLTRAVQAVTGKPVRRARR